MAYTYAYPRPSVTVDIAVFCKFNSRWKVLLIQRGKPPFEKLWALPGGFIGMDETLKASALRELEEETGLKDLVLDQFRAYGDPGRDPRGRTVSVVFYGFALAEKSAVASGDDASDARWLDLANPPALAFDHDVILEELISVLIREKKLQ
jgi:8-oxo-dGTP diphosphatase